MKMFFFFRYYYYLFIFFLAAVALSGQQTNSLFLFINQMISIVKWISYLLNYRQLMEIPGWALTKRHDVTHCVYLSGIATSILYQIVMCSK